MYCTAFGIFAQQCIDLGVFKTTPNNAGVGLLDISTIIDNYVSADNIATSDSEFKINGANGRPIPTHLIDQYSRADHSVRGIFITGYTEYTDNTGTIQTTSTVTVVAGQILNAICKRE